MEMIVSKAPPCFLTHTLILFQEHPALSVTETRLFHVPTVSAYDYCLFQAMEEFSLQIMYHTLTILLQLKYSTAVPISPMLSLIALGLITLLSLNVKITSHCGLILKPMTLLLSILSSAVHVPTATMIAISMPSPMISL